MDGGSIELGIIDAREVFADQRLDLLELGGRVSGSRLGVRTVRRAKKGN
jgi:hypothetical protein